MSRTCQKSVHLSLTDQTKLQSDLNEIPDKIKRDKEKEKKS